MTEPVGKSKPAAYETQSDEQLTALARHGEHGAFDELVRRHRMKAFTWASRMANDPHLSEDIVQEALIRAFLNMGTLIGNDRFLGWLKGIVRNQALMRLRRGGPYAKETPLTAYARIVPSGQPFDPSNLDSLMDYLMSGAPGKGAADGNGDPQLRLERQEWYGMVKELLRRLTPREKAVFESHFFEQCSPQEIAELFCLSVGNVYKLISRSRLKVQEERTAFLIRCHIRQRKDEGMVSAAKMDPEPLKSPAGAQMTGTEMLHRFVRARYPGISRARTDGFLMAGFMLNIEKTRVDMSSMNMIDRNYYILNGMRNLGMKVGYKEAFDFDPPDPKLMTEAIALAQESVDNGVPAMVWELLNAEFGLIYGYDDEKQRFDGLDSQTEASVPYDSLGRLQTRSLFVLGYLGDSMIGPADALWRICRMIVRHARGGDATFTGYVNGLAAYETWMEVFRKREIEPLGHAYTISVVHEARANAAEFLGELAAEWRGSGRQAGAAVAGLLDTARDAYARAKDGLMKLGELFPAPAGGEPADPAAAGRALHLLEEIRAAETAGVEALERLAGELERLSSRSHVDPIVENPPRAYYM